MKFKDVVVEFMVSFKGVKSLYVMGMIMGVLVDFGGYEDFFLFLCLFNCKVNDF